MTACLFNSSRFQRLLPLRRAMTELESDIREAHHAISDAMRSD